MPLSIFTHPLCCSLLPLALGIFVLCMGGKTVGEPNELFSQASCDFGVDLLKVQLKGNEGNVVLSPSSVGVLLAIVQQGAKENTLKQLDSVLRMSAKDSRKGYSGALKSLQREKNNVTVEWGNRAYIKPGYKVFDGFKRAIKKNFGADIEELDFVEPSPQVAAYEMNGWVKEVTHDHIKDLVSPSDLTPRTALVLLNAIYFKGRWDAPFKKARTAKLRFEWRPRHFVKVPFMSQTGRYIAGEDSEAGVQWLNFLYKDQQFSMLFILPLEKHGLEKVLEKMSGSLLNEIINYDITKSVTIYLPKFKLQKKAMLVKALSKLGLTDIFTSDANLKRITHVHDLFVSKIIHEASVEIDESGTTATAASQSVLLTYSPFRPDPFTFRANHPFLFFIVDRVNKVPLFAGRVSDPSSTRD